MKRSIAQLKEWFRRGKYPTEAQFADWLDSYVHKDGVVPVSQVENLGWLLNGKFSTSRGETLELLMQALRREFDRHKEDADDEFEKIENNRQALVAEDERQQGEINTIKQKDVVQDGQFETLRQIIDPSATYATLKARMAALGDGYDTLWGLAYTLKNFLKATDTANETINRWQELEAFLQGVTDRETLGGMLEALDSRHEAMIDDAIILVSAEQVTWAELKEKRDQQMLYAGKTYRITDYETKVANDPEARSAGHPFDVVVLALDAGTLSERAWAMRSARDTAGYFARAKLKAWQVWYCLDNDATRFQWADTATGKGVIYRLIDEWGNDCPYDFKNVQFKRCLTSGGFVDNVVDDADWPNTHYILSPSMDGQAGMSVDETDYKWFYTFTYLEQMQNVRDASLINEVNADFDSAYYNKACNCNEMQTYYIGGLVDDTANVMQALNNIVLSSYDEENGPAVKLYGNKWGAGCFNMTLHEHCYGNRFGVNCFNVVSFKLYYNTFGNDCDGNTFGNYCYDNSFGNYFCNNSFGNDCGRNTFGNYLRYITAGEGVNYLNVTGGSDSSHYVQNAHILNGTAGKSSSERLTVGLPEKSAVCRYVGQNTAGALKIWVPADLV